MKTIIAIVGPSGSGKTHLVKFLRKELNIPTIISYTSRPKRPEEKEGIDHFFLPVTTQLPPAKEMLAHTFFAGHDYFALHTQVPDRLCTYIIDEKGLEELTLEHSVGSALGALPHFCGRFPRACPRTVLTCLHVHGSPL